MQESTLCLKWCWVSRGPSNFEAGHFIDSRNSHFLSWPGTRLELAVGQTWRMNTVFPALPSCVNTAWRLPTRNKQTVSLPRDWGRLLHGKCLQQKNSTECLVIYQNQKILEIFRVGQRKREQKSKILIEHVYCKACLILFHFIVIIIIIAYVCMMNVWVWACHGVNVEARGHISATNFLRLSAFTHWTVLLARKLLFWVVWGCHIVGGEFNGHSTLHESVDLSEGGQAYSSLWSPHPDRHGTRKTGRTKVKIAEAIVVAAENQGVKSNQIWLQVGEEKAKEEITAQCVHVSRCY